MKNLSKKNLLLICSILTLLFLFSCNKNKLTNGGVLNMVYDNLPENHNFTQCSIKDIEKIERGEIPAGTSSWGGMTNSQFNFQTIILIDKKYSNYGWPPSKYNELESQGFITQTKTGGNYFYDYYSISLTDKSEKYFCGLNFFNSNTDGKIEQYVFFGYDIEVNADNDIKILTNEKGQIAEADVTFHIKNISPIQEIFSPVKETVFTKSLKFKQFDDGTWKMEDVSKLELSKIKTISNPLHWLGN